MLIIQTINQVISEKKVSFMGTNISVVLRATALDFYWFQKQRRNYFHILQWSFRCFVRFLF